MPVVASLHLTRLQGPSDSGQLVTVFYGQDKYLCYICTHSMEPEPTLWPSLGRLVGCAEPAIGKCTFLVENSLGLRIKEVMGLDGQKLKP